jgi:hypothetical protein
MRTIFSINYFQKPYSSKTGVANFFGARAKLFGKTLQRAFFALEAEISKSLYLL